MDRSIKPKHEVKGYIKGIIHTKGQVPTFKTDGTTASKKIATSSNFFFYYPFAYTHIQHTFQSTYNKLTFPGDFCESLQIAGRKNS